jgi:hypothetical protein
MYEGLVFFSCPFLRSPVVLGSFVRCIIVVLAVNYYLVGKKVNKNLNIPTVRDATGLEPPIHLPPLSSPFVHVRLPLNSC